jgi:hypothetical protein
MLSRGPGPEPLTNLNRLGFQTADAPLGKPAIRNETLCSVISTCCDPWKEEGTWRRTSSAASSQFLYFHLRLFPVSIFFRPCFLGHKPLSQVAHKVHLPQ